MTKLELEIHPVQAQILSSLLLRPSATFSRLNQADLPTDNFSFHMRRYKTSV